jgi:glycosyltransferase involved in cell wall biosynthesis
MRIGIDVRELTGRPTGVGRYLAEVLTAWAAPRGDAGAGHAFVLYGTAPLPAGLADRLVRLPHAMRVLPGSGGTAWEQRTLPRAAAEDSLDVFFAPAYTAPLRLRCPLTLTIHDLSYFAHPEWFGWREGVRRRLLTRLSARRARSVLTDTQFSRDEIQSHLGLPSSRIAVIPLGAGLPAALTGARAQAAGSGPAGRERVVLFVGSVFNRRRVPDLIAAFGLVAGRLPDARLEIIGENRTFPPQDLGALARASGAGDRIRIRSYVPEGDLADAFSRASAFAFLSEYEGFGLPPLEALAAGIPPVLLDTPVAREVCGAAARYVAPGDVEGTAAALADLLGSDSARARVLAEAPAVLSRYSWPATATRTMEALEAAGAGRHA